MAGADATSVARWVLHVDMDAFFASVEQRDFPHLRGKPVLVGGSSRRGVVAAASYEARRFGCRSAMPMAQALRLCPEAVVCRGRFDAYADASSQMFAILDRVSPVVEGLSIDEAFVDVTDSLALLGDAVTLARQIRHDIRTELSLTASIGVASNKFLAKLASDLDKPDGLTVAPREPDAIVQWLAPMPVERLWGIGPKSAAQFHAKGVRTIGDLQRWSLEQLEAASDQLESHRRSFAQRLYHLCRGCDDRPVEPHRTRGSVGHEQTFDENLSTPQAARAALLSAVETVARRLRQKNLLARRMTIKLRSGSFQTWTRGTTLPDPSNLTQELWDAAVALFEQWASRSFVPLRLIGATAHDVTPPAGQQLLLPDPDRDRSARLDAVTDSIVERFGKGAITRGALPAKRQAFPLGDHASRKRPSTPSG